MDIIAQVSKQLNLRTENARRAIELLDEGATIPFIARYRKEVTGGMDEEQLRQLEKGVAYGRQLTERKTEVLATIQEQGKLTAELTRQIDAAVTLQEVEDLYLPFRPKRRTRATIAREKGLEPLADMVLAQKTFRGTPAEYAAKFVNAEKGVASAADALAGARDIIAERIAEDAEVRRTVRELMQRSATLGAKLAKNGADKDPDGKYQQYYEYNEPLSRIPPHRRLALNRGEKEGVLSVGIGVPPEVAERAVERLYVQGRSIFEGEVRAAVADSLKRLALPSIENEIRATLTEEAEAHAIKIFAANLRQLLLQPPIQGKVVLGIDPGFRTGCKIAVIDPTGKPIEVNQTIYPHEPQKDTAVAKKILTALIAKHKVEIIAIGNGTASRETESFVAELISSLPAPKPAYIIVSEAGASVYSASEIARQEFPNLDATQRGNISIARRLQDPLAELVKIDPKSIGVGLYQHDVDQKQLAATLDAVVESCVNYVGVDVNTASVALLKHVSGVNKKVAENIVAYREKNGAFKSRDALRKVPGMGEKTFEQAAGFLKIPSGQNPLDNTFIHPESYTAATKLLGLLADNATKKLPPPDKVKSFRADLLKNERKLTETARTLGVGAPTLRDILDDLEKPGRDPREELPKPLLRQDILKMEDLQPGMILKGTVRNVVDFGAFVDIGVKQDGLVHVTEMSDRFVKNPLEIVNVGDVLDVRVLQVDARRGRISLSLKNATPG
jgi:protein Tex